MIDAETWYTFNVCIAFYTHRGDIRAMGGGSREGPGDITTRPPS
jgi:hypothetical protein